MADFINTNGVIDATGETVELNTAGMGVVAIQVVGTGLTATLTIQGTVNNSDYVTLTGVDPTGETATTFTASGVKIVPCSGYSTVRLYGTSVGAGSASVVLQAIPESAAQIMLGAFTLSTSDIEIGAVELKDAATDSRASIEAANTARTTSTKVLAVQHVNADGTPGVLDTSTLAKESGGNLDTIAIDTTSIDGKITACDTGSIAGTVTANAGTNLNTSALALESGGNLDTIAGDTTSIDGKITACDTGAVTVSTLTNSSINGPGAPTVNSYTHAAISAAANTANQSLVAAPGASKQIWVYVFAGTADTGDGSISLQDEDDTAISGVMPVSEKGGIALNPSGNFAMPLFKVATNKALEIDTVTCGFKGIISYAIVSV